MANITIKIQAEPYYNIEAMNNIAMELENGDYALEDGGAAVYEINGDHFKSTVEVLESERKDSVNEINNVFHFIHNVKFERDENGNYYPELVLKAHWPSSTEHIKDKWTRIFRQNDGNETAAMLQLYSDVDKQHRRVMTEWVMDNYDCGSVI